MKSGFMSSRIALILSVFILFPFRPKRLTLRPYKEYWFVFKDTTISYYKNKEASSGEPIEQFHLRGEGIWMSSYKRTVLSLIFVIWALTKPWMSSTSSWGFSVAIIRCWFDKVAKSSLTSTSPTRNSVSSFCSRSLMEWMRFISDATT